METDFWQSVEERIAQTQKKNVFGQVRSILASDEFTAMALLLAIDVAGVDSGRRRDMFADIHGMKRTYVDPETLLKFTYSRRYNGIGYSGPFGRHETAIVEQLTEGGGQRTLFRERRQTPRILGLPKFVVDTYIPGEWETRLAALQDAGLLYRQLESAYEDLKARETVAREATLKRQFGL